MRVLLIALGLVAAVFVLIGLLFEALQWLLVLGLLAFLVAVVAAVVLFSRASSESSDSERRG